MPFRHLLRRSTTSEVRIPDLSLTHGVGTTTSCSIRKSKPVELTESVEYQLSEIDDQGAFLAPLEPGEEQGRKPIFWHSRSGSMTSSSNRSFLALSQDEAFTISRESFESYRRSFDISTYSPITPTCGNTDLYTDHPQRVVPACITSLACQTAGWPETRYRPGRESEEEKTEEKRKTEEATITSTDYDDDVRDIPTVVRVLKSKDLSAKLMNGPILPATKSRFEPAKKPDTSDSRALARSGGYFSFPLVSFCKKRSQNGLSEELKSISWTQSSVAVAIEN